MKRALLLAAGVLLVTTVVVLAVGASTGVVPFAGESGDGPGITVENEGGGAYGVVVYHVTAETTFQVERADGTTATVPVSDVEAIGDATNLTASDYAARAGFLVFPNETLTVDAAETGTYFVYVVTGTTDADGRFVVGQGVVDCRDASPSAAVTVANGTAMLEPDACG